MAKAEGHSFEFVDESYINPGFLEVFAFDSPDQYIKTETDTIYLIKWQTKFNSYMPNNIKECPFCKD